MYNADEWEALIIIMHGNQVTTYESFMDSRRKSGTKYYVVAHQGAHLLFLERRGAANEAQL